MLSTVRRSIFLTPVTDWRPAAARWTPAALRPRRRRHPHLALATQRRGTARHRRAEAARRPGRPDRRGCRLQRLSFWRGCSQTCPSEFWPGCVPTGSCTFRHRRTRPTTAARPGTAVSSTSATCPAGPLGYRPPGWIGSTVPRPSVLEPAASPADPPPHRLPRHTAMVPIIEGSVVLLQGRRTGDCAHVVGEHVRAYLAEHLLSTCTPRAGRAAAVRWIAKPVWLY